MLRNFAWAALAGCFLLFTTLAVPLGAAVASEASSPASPVSAAPLSR